MSNYLKLSNQNIELKKSIIDEIIAKLKITGGFLPLISRVRIAVNENIGSVTYAEAITLKDDILTFKSVVLSIPYCDFVAESSTIITLNSYSNDLLLELLDNMPDFESGRSYYIMAKGYFTDDNIEFNYLCKFGEIQDDVENDPEDENIFFYFDKNQKIIGDEGTIFIHKFEVVGICDSRATGNELLIMLKIINETKLIGFEHVRVITTDSDDTLYCSMWDGEHYSNCWKYPNNDRSEPCIYLGNGRYVYKNDEVVGFEHSYLYGNGNFCLTKLPFNEIAQKQYDEKIGLIR